MIRLAIVLLLCAAIVSCATTRSVGPRPALEDEGQLFVYLEPLPQGSDRLRFRVQDVGAVREDGSVVRLTPVLPAVSGSDRGRERYFAAGPLPAGRYTGLDIRFSAASVAGESDGGALVLSGTPTRVTVPFAASARRGTVLALRLEALDAIFAGYQFTPHFVANVPDRPPLGALALAASRAADVVTFFDKTTGRVTAVVPTDREPGALALDPERHRAYVPCAAADTVQQIDLQEAAVLQTLRLQGGDAPAQAVLTPDGQTLLVVNRGSSSMSFVDPQSFVERSRVQVGNGPSAVLLDRQGRRAYVFNTLADSITVIDVVYRAVVATVPTESGPVWGQFDRAGTRLYVLHRTAPDLLILDAGNASQVGRINVGPGGTALKIDPRDDRLYLARRGAGSISIFDPGTVLPVDSIAVDVDVDYLTIDGESNQLVLLASRAAEVRSVRLVGRQVATRTELPEETVWVVLPGER